MRLTTIRYLLFGVLALVANSWAQQRPANSRKGCQVLRSRFVGSNSSDPIHLERTIRCCEYLSFVGVGT
jgi:hypothetical protein